MDFSRISLVFPVSPFRVLPIRMGIRQKIWLSSAQNQQIYTTFALEFQVDGQTGWPQDEGVAASQLIS